MIKHSPGCLAQMIRAAENLTAPANVIAVEKAPQEVLHQYGVVGVGERRGNLLPVTSMIEKPKPGQEPSNLIITGRYVLQPEIFELLATQRTGAGGEIQLTDAMISLVRTQSFYGVEFNGRTFDCGSKIGFLAANVAYALDHQELARETYEVLRELLGFDLSKPNSVCAPTRAASRDDEKDEDLALAAKLSPDAFGHFSRAAKSVD